MSELKATTAQEIVRNEKDCDYMDELFGGVKMPPTQVYLKSEADKVIAEKDEKIDLYKRGFEESDKINAHLYAELRHANYKRCLDKAKRCEEKCRGLENAVIRCSTYPYMSTCPTDCDPRYTFFKRWHKRWLGLAEKFKEAQ